MAFPRRILVYAIWAALLLCAVLCGPAPAGGRHNVLLVVNDSSEVSKAVGDYYQRARDIPPVNVCRIRCPSGEYATRDQYINLILHPIEDYLTTNNLREQIQFIVLTKGIPIRYSYMGATGVVDSDLCLAGQRDHRNEPFTQHRLVNPYARKPVCFDAFRSSADNMTEYQTPDTVRDIAPMGDGTVVAVGGQYVLRSQDGASWKAVPVKGSSQTTLNRVFFRSPSAGWTVGEDGSIFSTTDGGATWNKLGDSDGTEDSYTGVWFTSPTDGWVVGTTEGSRPVVLHTTDGGVSWSEQSTGATGPLNDIAFTDERNGWVVGDADLLRTTDGGVTWTSMRDSVPAGRLTRAFFVDTYNGWIVGGPGLVCRTTDGGNTWTQQPVPDLLDHQILDCHFSDAGNGWLVTDIEYDADYVANGKVLRTRDGGLTWTVVRESEVTRRAVYFANDRYGLVSQDMADQAPYTPVICRSTDSGDTWESVHDVEGMSTRLSYLVCRLDGYETDERNGGNGVPDDIENMINGSLAPETTGQFVLDPNPWDTHVADANGWLQQAADEIRSLGKDVLWVAGWDDFATGSYPGLGPVLGYSSWGVNDEASHYFTEWGKPGFVWQPGSVAACYVSSDARSLSLPQEYLRSSGSRIVDEGITGDDPDVIVIRGSYIGWTAELRDSEGRLVSRSEESSWARLRLTCTSPVEGYIRVYRSDGVTEVPGGRFPAEGTTLLSGGRGYRLGIGQSLIADYISEGACGAVGAVDEPGMIALHPEYLLPRYVDGFCWAESAYNGIDFVDFMFLVLGDPLMAPYATPPTVTITSPDVDNQQVSGTIAIRAEAHDADGIARAELWIDDIYHAAIYGSGPYEFTVDTTDLSDGLHAFEIVAYEASRRYTQQYAIRKAVTVNDTAGSIGDLAGIPNGSFVHLCGKIVTRSFADLRIFYVEEPDRSSGIRVVCSANTAIPEQGSKAEIGGVLSTGNGDERYVAASVVSTSSTGNPIPRPIGIRTIWLGGSPLGSASGVSDPQYPACSPYNLGLLVETWGTVRDKGEDFLRIDDGSSTAMVECRGFAPDYPLGTLVKVVGISSMMDGGRIVLVNDPSDIRTLD